jgi:predicted nucleotidyltransferase
MPMRNLPLASARQDELAGSLARGQNHRMRLEPSEIQAIRRAAQAVFGTQARVHVFGSRVRDDLKGGDLDLWLEVAPGQATLANELRFRDLIERPLDELKVDIVLHERGRPLSPIDQIARRDGVLL